MAEYCRFTVGTKIEFNIGAFEGVGIIEKLRERGAGYAVRVLMTNDKNFVGHSCGGLFGSHNPGHGWYVHDNWVTAVYDPIKGRFIETDPDTVFINGFETDRGSVTDEDLELILNGSYHK